MTALIYQTQAENETDKAKKQELTQKAIEIKADIVYAASEGGQLLQSIQTLQKLLDVDSIDLKTNGEYYVKRIVDNLNNSKNKKHEIWTACERNNRNILLHESKD